MPPARVWRVAKCVRSGPIVPTAIGLPRTTWQPMQPPIMKAVWPRAGSPVSPVVNVMVAGYARCGIAYAGMFSRGKKYPGAALLASWPVPVGGPIGRAGGFVSSAVGAACVAGAGVAAGAGPALKAAVAFCPAIQLSNCSCDTVNTRKRMNECDVPQYSVQNPFHTLGAIAESAVSHT